jgi:hypothetical protein
MSPAHASVRGVYIDDFSRGGRAELEWFQLAARARKLNKNLLGATDGFDLNSSVGNKQLHVYSMLQDQVVSQLREKVCRGRRPVRR